MQATSAESNVLMFDLSGKQFMECYKKATDWTPGTKRPEQPTNIERLKKSIAQMESTGGTIHEVNFDD